MTRQPSIGRLGLLALVWALAGPAGAAAPSDPAKPVARLADKAPGPAIVAAQRRLDAAKRLLWQAEEAQGETTRLQDQLARVERLRQLADSADQAARAALLQLTLPDLRAAQQAVAATGAEVSRLSARHLSAVAEAAQAPDGQTASAMAMADAQARARATAEQAHQAAQQRQRQAIFDAWRAIDSHTDRRNALQRLNSDLATELAEAAQRWTAVDERWRALRRAAVASAAPRAPVATPRGLVPAQAPWAQLARPAATVAERPDTGPLNDLQSAARAVGQAQDALWLRGDAAAFVRQTLAAAGNCGDAVCPAWQAEQQALADETAKWLAALAEAGTRQAGAQAEADALPAAMADRLAQATARREALASAAALARDPGQPLLRALAAEAELARLELVAARRQAERAFIAAWRAQYQQDPKPRLEAAAPAAAAAAMDMPPPAAGMMRPLRQHALHRMTQRNDEPADFGAYTYVVVGTGAGLDSDGVRQRLARLLATLQNLTPAEQIEAEQRLGTNVFVVPVQAGNTQQPALAYELRLAQALMSHVPPALLMPGRLQRALLTSNGPFLITLPGRLADAQASWPVLFADLNSVPEAVVGDVVRSYMGDLLVGFKPSDAGWKPPALQRVALTLVRLVQGTGEVVLAAFPASMAAPAPR